MEPEIAGQAAQTLLALTDQQPDQAARHLERLVGELSDPRAIRDLDHALVQLLQDRPVADPILEQLDLDRPGRPGAPHRRAPDEPNRR